MDAKEYLHSDELSEWDTVFDPGGKQEYTEEQLIRFTEIYTKKIAVEFYKSQVKGNTIWSEEKRTFEANVLYEDFKLKQ